MGHSAGRSSTWRRVSSRSIQGGRHLRQYGIRGLFPPRYEDRPPRRAVGRTPRRGGGIPPRPEPGGPPEDRGKYLRFFRLADFPHGISDQGHFNGTENHFMTLRKVPQGRRAPCWTGNARSSGRRTPGTSPTTNPRRARDRRRSCTPRSNSARRRCSTRSFGSGFYATPRRNSPKGPPHSRRPSKPTREKSVSRTSGSRRRF